jgi:hypothetical protein
MTLKAVSTADLQAELARREKAARGLASRRERIVAELRSIEAELALFTDGPRARIAASVPAARATRAHNPIPLADALASLVTVGATISPAEAAEKVKEAGYESEARTFGMMVATTLAKDKQRWKRVSRGLYVRLAQHNP